MPELHCETITFPSSDGRHTSSAVHHARQACACSSAA